jgi:UDP-N-acetyl-D-galactosamine dehydrogenase
MKICILGLGYVGLPLAVALAKNYAVTGFDVNDQRIRELKEGKDITAEIEPAILSASSIAYSSDETSLHNHDVYIVTVPTPVDDFNKPDFSLLLKASAMIGPRLRKGNIVVFESTVYPGVTEDICGPEIEKHSGFKSGVDFFLGYSPERINPGDKTHTVDKITKVVAGQTPEVTEILREIYSSVTKVFVAKDIKTAEAAKVIENTQRDINIAFMNEITGIFNKLNLSVYDVLEAAQTKWNFLPFTPGLVGGHCIGVDPFYLAECAIQVGYHPEIILAGRRINDGMGQFIADQVHQKLCDIFPSERSLKILVLGITFKENVPDLRNTKVIDVIKSLEKFGHAITVVDSWANDADAKKHYDIALANIEELGEFDGLIGAVSHEEYKNLNLKDFERLVKPHGLIMDIKNMWDKNKVPSNRVFSTL